MYMLAVTPPAYAGTRSDKGAQLVQRPVGSRFRTADANNLSWPTRSRGGRSVLSHLRCPYR
jgi:hypothetical protein